MTYSGHGLKVIGIERTNDGPVVSFQDVDGSDTILTIWYGQKWCDAETYEQFTDHTLVTAMHQAWSVSDVPQS